jgi:hypothetical protein
MDSKTILTIVEKHKYGEIRKLLRNSFQTLSEVEAKLYNLGQFNTYNKLKKLIRQMEKLSNELH